MSDSTFRPVHRKPAPRSKWPIAMTALLAGCVGLTGGWFLRGAAEARGTVAPVVQGRKLPAEAKPIARWLAENLDDPDWQLVKFWMPREMKEVRREEIVEMQEKVDVHDKYVRDHPGIFDQSREAEWQEVRDRLTQLKDSPPEVISRIRYRSRIGSELKLRDEYFVIKPDGRAERTAAAYAYKRRFPDEE